MKKYLSVFLSVVIILCSVICPLIYSSAENTDTTYLNDAANWATYNSSNVKNGWWGAPVAVTHNGKSAIKINSMDILVTATKLAVEKNTNYSISFAYCGGVLSPKVLKTVGIATLTNGEVVHKASGDVYNSGSIGDTTDWNTFTFQFNSGDNEELELFVLPDASSTEYADNPVYLADFIIEKIEEDKKSPYLNDAANWATYNSSNVKNGWWGAPVAVTHNGKSAIKINSMDILVTATKLAVEKNTNYSISFAYCGGVLSPKVLKTVGIATLTNGEVVYKASGDVYNSGSIGDTTDWNTFTFQFNSGDNEELELFVLPDASSTEYADNPIYLADFIIEETENAVVPLPPSDAPALDENGYRLLDMEKENIITGDTDYIKQLKTGGYGNNGATLYLPAYDHTVTANPTKVTALNFGAIHTNRNDPYFRTAVDPSANYKVTVRVKKTTDVETTARLLLYGDWYGYYDNKTIGTSNNIEYSSMPLNEWKEYSFRFSTASNQNEIAFYFNAGEKYPELYIDEVEVVKVQPLYSGPKDKTVIDFECDPGFYSHIKSANIDFEKIKGPDGKESTAMHFKERPQTADSNVTFTSFNTVLEMKDPYLTIPVLENSLYTLSYWMKVDESKSSYWGAKSIIFADFRGRGVAGNGISQNYFYTDIVGTDWTEYTVSFLTLPGQTTATFAINAGANHPSMWIDNVTYTKTPAGALGSTELSYCESEYNLVSSDKRNITKKTVIKAELAANIQYTLGVDLSGSGRLTFAFDESGANVIKAYDISKLKGRIGVDLITDSANKNLYFIFEPTGSGITYKDLYLFAKYSLVGTEFEMGYAENINLRKPIDFSNIPTVVGDDRDSLLEDIEDITSPSTGDNTTAVCVVAVTGLISALAVLLFKRKNNLNEVNK